MLSLSKHLADRRISFSPISFYFLSSFKGWAFETLNASFPFPQVFSLSPFPLTREPTVTAWRGTTLSTRINKCRALIMPPRFVRRLRNNMAQSLVLFVKLGVRFARRRCGSCSVFEVAHSFYKCAPNGLSFRVWVSHPFNTKPTILRNCGWSFCP